MQELVRKRMGLPVDKANGRAKQCAWVALLGECTKQGCESCAGKLKVPGDLLEAVKATCDQKILRVMHPKKPG